VHEHHAHAGLVDVGIEAKRVADEVVHAGDRLNASEASSGDDERHERLAAPAGALGVSLLEVRDEPVPEKHGVSQRLHRQGPLLEAWQVVEVRDRAQRDHQEVVGKVVLMAIGSMRDHHAASWKVDTLDDSLEEARLPQDTADGADNVGQVEVARRHLVKHRGEEKEVVPVDERDLDVRVIAQPSFSGRVIRIGEIGELRV